MPSKQPALFNGVTQRGKQRGGGREGGEGWGCLGEKWGAGGVNGGMHRVMNAQGPRG